MQGYEGAHCAPILKPAKNLMRARSARPSTLPRIRRVQFRYRSNPPARYPVLRLWARSARYEIGPLPNMRSERGHGGPRGGYYALNHICIDMKGQCVIFFILPCNLFVTFALGWGCVPVFFSSFSVSLL